MFLSGAKNARRKRLRERVGEYDGRHAAGAQLPSVKPVAH